MAKGSAVESKGLGFERNFSCYLYNNGYKSWLESHFITSSSSIGRGWGGGSGGGRFTSQDIFFFLTNEIKYELTSTHSEYY